MYLVDTNVVSEVRRGGVEAVGWLRSVNPLAVYLSVITLGEIMRGIALKQKADPRAASPSRAVAANPAKRSRRPSSAHHGRDRPRVGPDRGPAPPRRRRRTDRGHGDRPRPHRRHAQRRGFRRYPSDDFEPLGHEMSGPRGDAPDPNSPASAHSSPDSTAYPCRGAGDCGLARAP